MTLKSLAIEKIKSLLPELGKQAETIRQEESRILERMQLIAKERKELLEQPITRDDYAELVCIDIDRIADGYRRVAAQNIGMRIGPDKKNGHDKPTVELAIRMEKRNSLCLLSGMRHAGEWDNDARELSQGAATFLFRDAMKAAAIDVVNAVEPWPFPNAKPLVESIARIEAIDQEMQVLLLEKTELDQVFRQLGLEPTALPASPEPERSNWPLPSKGEPAGVDPRHVPEIRRDVKFENGRVIVS